MTSSTQFDKSFGSIEGLVWLPWVGEKLAGRPDTKRLLVAGETHYAKPDSPDKLAKVIQDHIDYKAYTRDVVSECLIDQDWPNRTLDTLPKLLFGTADIDREHLWADTAYYNFVQRMMHYNREGQPERPTWDDFLIGWKVFVEIIRVLRPSHCLFIGVEASNSFDYAMKTAGVDHTAIRRTEYISRTQARVSSLTIDGHTTELIFVQHLGKFFSWSQWHGYLRSHHATLTDWMEAEHYTNTKG